MAAGGQKIFGVDEFYVKIATRILAVVAVFICWKRFSQPRGFGTLVKIFHYNAIVYHGILECPFFIPISNPLTFHVQPTVIAAVSLKNVDIIYMTVTFLWCNMQTNVVEN